MSANTGLLSCLVFLFFAFLEAFCKRFHFFEVQNKVVTWVPIFYVFLTTDTQSCVTLSL